MPPRRGAGAGGAAAAEPYAALADGTPVYAGLGKGAFAEETVVGEPAVVRLPDETDTDVPRLLELAAAGQLDLAALQTGTTDLAGIDAAFEDLRRGHGARTLVRLNGGRP